MYKKMLFVWVRNRVLVIISSIYKSSQIKWSTYFIS